MAKKGEQLKWNTPKGTSLDQVKRALSGELDARGRKPGAVVRSQAHNARETRLLSHHIRSGAKSR